MSSQLNSWTVVPEKQENINHQINTVLQGHKKYQRNRIFKVGIGISVILVFVLVLAVSKRADFSESFLADVLQDTELDQLFGVEVEQSTPENQLAATPTLESEELNDLESLFGTPEKTPPAGGDDLEDIFAETEKSATTVPSPGEENSSLEDVFGAVPPVESEVQLEDVFSPEEIKQIEALTEASAVSGIIPVTFDERDELSPEGMTEPSVLPGGTIPAEEEPLLSAAPVLEIEEESETTIPFGEEEISLPGEEETTIPFGEEEISLPGEEEISLPEMLAQKPSDTGSSFRMNFHTVKQTPVIGVKSAAGEFAAPGTYYSSAMPAATVVPESGPEFYLIMCLSLLISGGIWRMLVKVKVA
jgi:hypothetical protein